MNWDDVDALCRVIEHGGFTAAARAMNRPKSSVSAAIARLEAQLGTRLLERSTRRMRLTDAGSTLYLDVGATFARLREIRIEATGMASAVAGTLRIAAPYEFGAHHVGMVACAMLQRYPDLRIEIEVEHARIDPLDRRFDIVFSMYDEDEPEARSVARRVFTLPRALFAAPALVARQHAPAHPNDLAGLPVVAAPGESAWGFTDPNGTALRVPIAPRMRSSNADIRRQAAIAGHGVVRVTATFCATALKAGQLVRLLPEWTCTPLRVYALLPGRRLVPPKVRLFLDQLTAIAGT